MARATGPEHADRLNLAFGWLRQGLSPSEAAERLASAARISQRQAHRYLEQARQLKAPVPAVETKIVFTVKLPQLLVERLHRYAQATGETLSEIVARALWAVLRGGGGHG
jgi:hypothetical protein